MPILDSLPRHYPVFLWLERIGLLYASTFQGTPFLLARRRETQNRYEADGLRIDEGLYLIWQGKYYLPGKIISSTENFKLVPSMMHPFQVREKA